MSFYSLTLVNETSLDWVAALCLGKPNTPSGERVVWKRTAVKAGSISGMMWKIDYDVVLANYLELSGKRVFKIKNKEKTDYNTAWNVVEKDGHLVFGKGGSVPKGRIRINNASPNPINAGMCMDGMAFDYKREIPNGSFVDFMPQPKYYLCLCDGVEPGQVIDDKMIYTQAEVVFMGGQAAVRCIMSQDGADLKLAF